MITTFSGDAVRRLLERSVAEAKIALDKGDYPIGSVITDLEGNIRSVDRNENNSSGDITAHAEILGLRNLGSTVHKDTPGGYFLFSSLEPCFGCSFFLARTNVRCIYSALKDPHKGGTGDLHKLDQFRHFFSHIELVTEPFADLAQQSRQLMVEYFLKKGRRDAAAFYGYKET